MAAADHADVPLQQRAVVMGKQQKGAGADGNNRRALGDIGNLVNVRAAAEGKPLSQPSRPLTRGFCAQLLDDVPGVTEDAGVTKNAEKLDEEVRNGHEKGKKKAVVKPKPEEVIDTSSCSRSKPRKRIHTITSVLTARSKTACGISDKQKITHDIDGADANNQLAVVDYVEDIYKFYRMSESIRRPLSNYMDSQVQINARMRSILGDWMIEVHNKFELMPETLYLTFYIIDRYLSMEIVLRRELQLVGISAMLIASKYEEIWAPEVNDFICISDRAYSRDQILTMEKGILNTLEWNLTVPTPCMFLGRFLKAAQADIEMEHMAFFFAELGLVQYSMITYSPSMLAASAVYVARCTLGKCPPWSETLRHHTGYSEVQLLDCAKMLARFHSAVAGSKLKVVHRKYSRPERCAVALLPPAAVLI